MRNRVRVPFRQRYRDSRRILGQAFRFLGQNRDLWVFPVLGFLLMLVLVAVPMYLIMEYASSTVTDAFTSARGRTPFAPLLFLLIVLPLTYPFAVLATMISSAMAWCVHERMEGRPGRKLEGWSVARSHVGVIARFSLIAMLVGGVLSFVGALLDKLRIVPYVGRVVQMVGAFAWAAATFFVVPIIVVERQRSATQALKGSVEMAKQHWGKSVAGMVTIALAIMVPVFVVCIAAMAVAFLLVTGPGGLWFTFVLLGAIAVGVVFAGMLSQAAQTVYQVALFRYARTGDLSGPFDETTLIDPWKPYQV